MSKSKEEQNKCEHKRIWTDNCACLCSQCIDCGKFIYGDEL